MIKDLKADADIVIDKEDLKAYIMYLLWKEILRRRLNGISK